MDKTAILYTIGCPKCKILEKKLGSANITYDVIEDVDEMTALGIKSAPALGVDGKLLNFSEAVRWVNEYISERTPSD